MSTCSSTPAARLDVNHPGADAGRVRVGIVGDYQRYTTASTVLETADRLCPEEGRSGAAALPARGRALRALADRERDASLVLERLSVAGHGLSAGWAPAVSAKVPRECSEPGPHGSVQRAGRRLGVPKLPPARFGQPRSPGRTLGLLEALKCTGVAAGGRGGLPVGPARGQWSGRGALSQWAPGT